jgi:hypothetical protein
MKSITHQWLIERLHTAPSNDFEVGFNSAIILILKSLLSSDVVSGELTVEKRHQTALGLSTYMSIPIKDMTTLFHHYKLNDKLGWVKSYKEFMGMGLKEAKEVADKVWEL